MPRPHTAHRLLTDNTPAEPEADPTTYHKRVQASRWRGNSRTKNNNTKNRHTMKWLFESNRWKHLIGIFIVSLFGTALMGIGCIGGMEFKDVHHANGDSRPMWEWDWSAWDWLDCAAGAIGAAIATAIHLIVYFSIK